MTTFSTALKLELPGDGQQSGTWGQTTNKNIGTLLEQAITGVQSIIMLDANYTLSNLNGVSDEARNAVLVVTGTNSAVRNIVIPSVNKIYTVTNNTTGNYAILVKTAAGAGYSVPNGGTSTVYCDGTNVYACDTVATTPSVSDNSQAIATTAFVRSIVPSGVILMWSGSVASIPTGWYLCNGSNGTPNLQDRFIVGAGNSYPVNGTGGNNGVVLSQSNLPAHTHTYSGNTGAMSGNQTHSHSVNDPGHDHGMIGAGFPDTFNNTPIVPSRSPGSPFQSSSFVVGTGVSINAANVDHTHSYSGTTSSAGSGTQFDNRPPYYALCYIMKA